jgi:light-regulated signal transduction histidine kinase (bacteriophytochrome)
MKYDDQIFTIFQRLRHYADYAGTGVGLTLVRIAIERVGGPPWAESQPSRGTMFYLEIPKRDSCSSSD